MAPDMIQRKTWIDSLRALAIILVVLGHQLQGETVFFIFTSPIKIPLFFAISGYLFKMRNDDFVVFLKNLFFKLIIPWWGLSLIAYIPKLLSGGDLIEVFYSIISGKSFWFMPCFIIGETIHFIIRKYLKNEMSISIISITLTIIGLITQSQGILVFAMINCSLTVQFFFLIGFLFRNHEDVLLKTDWKYIIGGSVLYILLGLFSCYSFSNAKIDVHTGSYYNYPICFLMIVIGILVLLLSASKLDFSSKILQKIGANTLIIYIWHGAIIRTIKKASSQVGINVTNIWLLGILSSILGIFVCNLFAHFINRYIPELVGKKRSKK